MKRWNLPFRIKKSKSRGPSGETSDDGSLQRTMSETITMLENQPPSPSTAEQSSGLNKASSSKSFFENSKSTHKPDDELKSSANSLPQMPTSDHLSPKSGVADEVEVAPHPFQEFGSRMKNSFNLRRKDGKAAELKLTRRMSRRERNSDPCFKQFSSARRVCSDVERRAVNTKSPLGYMQLRAANLTSYQIDDSCEAIDHSLTNKLLEITGKNNFCDIEITGKDKVAVKAPSFLLACHSVIFEEIFYPKEELKPTYSIVSQHDARKLHIEFAAKSTIEAAIHFCATMELPPDVKNHTSEANIRIISQLQLFAQLFKVPPLMDAAYRTARRLINKDPSLACAAFDECTILLAKAESENNWGLKMRKQKYDDLKVYALDYLRESPMDTVMGPEPGPGVKFLSPASIEEIICDQEMGVDEYSMWRILNLWVKLSPGTKEDKIACAESLVSHIQLVFIDPTQLEYQIKKCEFVDPNCVEEALKKIEIMVENDCTGDKERVIVKGAGDDGVNGVYVFADDEIGLNADEVMFLKEGTENEDFSSDFGLYLWDGKWGISSSTDYFNLLYSCKVSPHKGHSGRRPPKWGWKCEGGLEKAPTCTWKPSKEEENMDATKLGIAPALSALKSEKTKDTGTRLKLNSSFTLDQMMRLPEDEEDCNSHQYPSIAKDLDQMMHMSVDEGHDDEVAGYDLNDMSANSFEKSLSNQKMGESKHP